MARNFLLFVLILFSGGLFAQANISVSTQGMSNTGLIEAMLENDNFAISNVTYQGGNNQLRYFSNNAGNLPIDSGLVLATGGASVIIGPNSAQATTTPVSDYEGSIDDSDLLILGSQSIDYNDIAVAEFDFVPTSDTARFNFSFASEEYNEFNCSSYADVAGILLSGPGISGEYSGGAINIATVPGADAGVGVNSVNNGTSTTPGNTPCENANPNWLNDTIYFNDNTYWYTTPWNTPPEDATNTEFDGFTDLLEANASVIPGETYHVKLIIGDGGDGNVDSALLIEAKSPVEYDCMALQANIGDPCNDDDPNTQNDQVNSTCDCAGLVPGQVAFVEADGPYVVAPYNGLDTGAGIVALNDSVESASYDAYWSEDEILDDSDEFLTSAGGEFTSDTLNLFMANYPLPLLQSNYYLITKLTHVNDMAISNGISQTYHVQFTENLVAQAHALIDSVFIDPGDTTASIDFQLFNNGPEDLAATEVEFYYGGLDELLEDEGVYVGSWTGGSLAVGDSLQTQYTFSIPLPIEQYEYYVMLVPVDGTRSSGQLQGPVVPIIFSSLSGISSASESGWEIYSNHSGMVSITPGSMHSHIQQVRVLDISGRQLWNQQIKMTKGNPERITLPQISRGIYLIDIRDGQNRIQKKVLLQ